MNRTIIPFALAASLAVGTMSSAVAQNTRTIVSPVAPNQEQATAATDSDERNARDWGLQPEEWTRYGEVMRGPLGIFSPGLDPLTALGIEARSDEERRRYAELQVQVEARRVEKMLAYQRAYDAAWQRLYPGMQRVDLTGTGIASSAVGLSSDEGRMAVFIKDGCVPCGQLVQQLQTSGAEFDLYMVGSYGDDARIRDWARRIRIDPARVRSGSITLNHDAGRWLSLGLQGDLPAVVRQVGGEWQRQ